MSFSGGVFTINSAGMPAVTGTAISSAAQNALNTDLATGLSTALLKDGTQTVTANIPMAAFKFTGLGAGSAATDSASMANVQGGAALLLGTVAGTNTITATLAPTLTAYTSGQIFTIIPANTNTGATTVNVDGLGAKNVFSGGVACIGLNFIAGVPVQVEYDGTQFNVLGGSKSTSFTGTLTGCTATITGTVPYTQIGALVILNVPTLTGTSNTTAKTLTGLPAALNPTGNKILVIVVQDNGATSVFGFAVMASNGVITFYPNAGSSPWTAAGTVTINAFQLVYTTA